MDSAKFTDEAGREWTLRLNFSLVRHIRDTLGIDLIDLKGQGEALAKMADNMAILVDTVYLMVEPQCKARSVSDVEFGEGLAGDCFERMRQALLESIINFTPPQDRGASTMIQAILTAARKQAVEEATKANLPTCGA